MCWVLPAAEVASGWPWDAGSPVATGMPCPAMPFRAQAGTVARSVAIKHRNRDVACLIVTQESKGKVRGAMQTPYTQPASRGGETTPRRVASCSASRPHRYIACNAWPLDAASDAYTLGDGPCVPYQGLPLGDRAQEVQRPLGSLGARLASGSTEG